MVVWVIAGLGLNIVIILSCSILVISVSYTHLDVYKRQAQGSQTASYAIDLGVRQTFLERSLRLNLMVRDLLNSRSRNSITYGNGFTQTINSYFSGRMIGLTATYNFGNMKPKKTDRKPESQDMNMDSGME